jgi:hypothetical protein
MAVDTVVHIGENSPEQVAFKLFHEVASAEAGRAQIDRKWILDTYAECLMAVTRPDVRTGSARTAPR